jgi:CheY-like chemotaxis protein
LDSRRSVLIVDSSDETRVVLQTALERRGVRTIAASQAQQGLAMAQEHHPDLIVLDLEIDPCGLDEVAGPFAEQSRSDRGSLVLLGSVRRPHLMNLGKNPVQGEYVAKPYHYGPLIRRIEEILSANPEKIGTVGQER